MHKRTNIKMFSSYNINVKYISHLDDITIEYNII